MSGRRGQRWHLVGLLCGAAGVLLTGHNYGPGWGVVAGTVWATANAAALLLLPPRPVESCGDGAR